MRAKRRKEGHRPVNRIQRLLLLLTALPAAVLSGCRRSPTFNILGSFFPSWLVCLFAGILFSVVANRVFARFALDKEILLPVVVYPCLALLFACLFWLAVFS
jgi:hypothetical protein